MAKPITDYLAQWMKRDDAYRERHRTDEAFAREEMTRHGLSPEHQEVFFRGDRDEIRERIRRELYELHGLTDDVGGQPWGF